METEKKKAEEREFGVFFDDDYDYLQHLKESVPTLEWVANEPAKSGRRPVDLTGNGKQYDEEEEEEEEEKNEPKGPAIPVSLGRYWGTTRISANHHTDRSHNVPPSLHSAKVASPGHRVAMIEPCRDGRRFAGLSGVTF